MILDMAKEPKKRKRKKAPPPEPAASLGDRMHSWRIARGLDQAEAAELVHISQSQWSLYENGKRIPTRAVAFLIESLLAKKR
jgi:DNA-binding XRE family transcriptional regulator